MTAPTAPTAIAVKKTAVEIADVAAADPRDQRIRDVAAQHEQRAMREIDDARHAENQRQSGGDQEQGRGAGKSVQQLDEQSGERHDLGLHTHHFPGARAAKSTQAA